MGTIVFDPSKGDWLSTKPYLGLDQDDGRSSINSWVNSLNGISNQRVAENDARDYKLIRGLWSKIKMKRYVCVHVYMCSMLVLCIICLPCINTRVI